MTLKNTAVKLDAKVVAIVHPTRLALTGSNVRPSLYHLLEVLGKEKVLGRIDGGVRDFRKISCQLISDAQRLALRISNPTGWQPASRVRQAA